MGITIRDNDPMILGFSERRQTISEAEVQSWEEFINREIFITSLRTSEISHNVGVRSVIRGEPMIEPVDGFSQNPRFDGLFGTREYNTINNLVFFEELGVGTTITPVLQVTIRDDLIPEDEECFVLSIYQVNPEFSIENFLCNMAGAQFLCIHEICITDNDEPFRIAFDQTMYTVVESAGSVEVCVNLTHPPDDILDEQVSVLVFHNDGSIYVPPNPTFASPDPPMGIFNSHNMISRSDYEEETQFASTIRSTFITEERRQICYDQVIYDDERLELMESAGLRLVPADPDSIIPIEVEPYYEDSVFFIIDDDEAVVGLERTIYTVSEDGNVVELCARVFEPAIDCPIEFPFDIAISTAGTTVTTLTFNTCEIRRCVNVNIRDDIDSEVIVFTITSTPGLDPRIRIRSDRTDDNIMLTVGYEITTYQTSESMGSVSLSIAVFNPPSGGAQRPFTLSVSSRGRTAVARDDYSPSTSSVIQFNVGDVRVTHTIRINQDQVCETDPDEVFFSDIALGSGMQPIIVIRPTAEITIEDSAEPECNPIRVGYELTVYTTDEGQLHVELCATISEPDSGGAPRPFSLLTSTSDGTAVFSDDYEPVTNEVLNFAIGQTTACHIVNTDVDDVCESHPNEFFFLNIVLGGGEQPIDVDPEQVQVIIDDTNEPECGPITVGYELEVYTMTEGNSFIELCAVIHQPHEGIAPRDFTVSSTTRNGTAMQGLDYVPTDVNLEFFRGDSQKCHSVKIITDGLCEPNPEDFFADMVLVSGSNISTAPSIAQILINDTNEDECGDMEHSTTQSSTDNTTAVIAGGAVAAVIVLVIAIAVFTVAIVAWKHHHRNPSIQHAGKFELTGLPSSAEGTAIETSENTAYDVMKQGGREPGSDEYEVVDSPTKGNYEENKYEVPLPPPVPAIPPSAVKEVVTYEVIPGDV